MMLGLYLALGGLVFCAGIIGMGLLVLRQRNRVIASDQVDPAEAGR